MTPESQDNVDTLDSADAQPEAWLPGLAGWLAGWLVGWLVGWLARWLASWLVGWLVGHIQIV